MAKYIKSHSNYRLATKHQNIKDGKILERDISTVGGVSSFATDQTTIHSNGNFVIVVNDSSSPSRHIEKGNWVSNNTSGVTWNNEALSNETSDVNGSVKSSIMLKNDYMDLMSFACYGSLVDLVQNSIGGILEDFPYEIYTGDGDIEYNKHTLTTSIDTTDVNYSGNTITSPEAESSVYIFQLLTSGNTANYVTAKQLYEISNPAGIDIHTRTIDSSLITNELQYFANDGFRNYSFYTDEYSSNPDDGYDFEWESDMNTIVDFHCSGKTISISASSLSNDDTLFAVYFDSAMSFDCIDIDGRIYETTYNKAVTEINTENGTTLYFRKYTDKGGNEKIDVNNKYCPEVGDFVSKIKITIPKYNSGYTFYIYAYRDENLDVEYLVEKENLFFHLRPKPSLSYYDNFIDSLNLFQKTLLGIFSNIKNTAKFEVKEEGEYGITTQVQTFVFPTMTGGYNLGGTGADMSTYLHGLSNIALKYDELYSDNMYRMMTHESLKNLDWTKDFNGNDGTDDNDNITNGEKFKSIIRIMGFFFDQEKAYIDCLGNQYTVTYNNRDNIPDYFVTDALENDGWVIDNLSPYDMLQYEVNGDLVEEDEWSEINQRYNYFTRQFIENNNNVITPYGYKENPSYYDCDESGKLKVYTLDKDSDREYYTGTGKALRLMRTYYSDKEYSTPDISNEFYKRLKINSRHLLRKKGTVEGIESMLALLGFRNKDWFQSLGKDVQDKYLTNNNTLPYDYEIHEYTTFAQPITETWDSAHNMYRIDWINSCKTIPYNTENYIGGIYVPYQGLPVAYRDIEGHWLASDENGVQYETTNKTDTNILTDNDGNLVKVRKLYPFFDNQGEYDGGMYYQMKGGWLNYVPYSFDKNGLMVCNDNLLSNKETLSDIKQYKDLSSLTKASLNHIDKNDIVYVNDLSDNYAVIDGKLYELLSEEIDGNIYYYFNVEVNDGIAWIGDNSYQNYFMYSTPDGENNISTCYLPAYNDGSIIKVYYDETNEEKFYIRSYDEVRYYCEYTLNGETYTKQCESDTDGAYPVYINEVMPQYTDIFLNGSYHIDYKNYTHYFKLISLDNYSCIGDHAWKQLSYHDSDYMKVSTISDYLDGNNPHCGHSVYDSGYEYIQYFNQLFKYSLENQYFDEDNFINTSTMYDEIATYGFSGLSATTVYEYLNSLGVDTKVHGFTNKICEGDVNNDSATTYTINHVTMSGNTKVKAGLVNYDLDSDKSLKALKYYNERMISGVSDSVTSQIMNTKVIEIRFSLKSDSYYNAEGQTEIKYIQDKIMPYVEQMIPSSAIVMITTDIYPYHWILDEDNTYKKGWFHPYFFFKNDGIWEDGEDGE